MRTRVLFLGAAVVAFAMAGSLQAYALAFTTGDWAGQSFPGNAVPGDAPWGANGYPGDSVAFLGETGLLSLGTQTLQIGQIDWEINYTYNGTDGTAANDSSDWPDLTFNFNVPIDISFDGGLISTILLPGTLQTTWENDYLQFANGGTSSFTVGSYVVEVTPLAIANTGGSNFSGSPAWQQPQLAVMAEFTVRQAPSPVPEPASMTILGLGILGLAGARRLRKRA